MISDHLGSANPILIRELNVEGGDHFEIWGTMTFPTRTSHGLSISFDWSVHDAKLLHQFFVALPQLQISGIHICDMPLISRSKWQRVFARENMASIKSVVISARPECFGGLIRFLSEPIASVPTLRSLKCIDMDFVGMHLWLDHLQEVLQTRKENGVPLQKISFYRCSSLDEELVGHSEDIVPTVIISDDFPSDDESSDGDFDGSLDDELEDS
ncbi:hypothetical protein EWM64_g9853 [Hericium alpestre]|uniref:F-box domain-containing protein n=1 Tax=Hericium alpestre TaxID=135208 RepID=A0A4Y9ZL61_9AGAM|nr:hypothetical protein EWM64_g9853 [Hericium alpestre]